MKTRLYAAPAVKGLNEINRRKNGTIHHKEAPNLHVRYYLYTNIFHEIAPFSFILRWELRQQVPRQDNSSARHV